MLANLPQPNSFPPCQRQSKSTITPDYNLQEDYNYNPEFLPTCEENQEAKESKSTLSRLDNDKINKKLGKKRKRQKQQSLRRQARQQLGKIVQQLYQCTCRFEQHVQTIKGLVGTLFNYGFQAYMDQLIINRVKYLQNTFKEYTQSIQLKYLLSQSEDNTYYSQIVDWMYDRFREINNGSLQIQKFNNYIHYGSSGNQEQREYSLQGNQGKEKQNLQNHQKKEQIIYNYLAIDTFSYIIETDQTLKNLFLTCDEKISPDMDAQRKHIDFLKSVIDIYYDSCKEYQEEEIKEDKESIQTFHNPNYQHEQDENFKQPRRRHKKIRENELISTEETLICRLEAFLICQEKRSPCRLSEESLSRFELKAAKYRK